jgi:polysaccharide biosynthesis protein PslH
MRVLHLTPELPYAPGGGGGRTREFYLCRRLVELGHEVVNVSPATAEDLEHVDALDRVGVPVVAVPRPDSQLVEAARGALKEPAVLARALTGPVRALEMRIFWIDLRERALAEVERFRPDVVLVGHDMAAAWARDLPPDLPAVLTCHNLTWNWYISRARRTRGAHALAMRAEAWRYRAHVVRQLPRFHSAIAVSTIERDQLLEIGRSRVELIPTGVDTDDLTPAQREPGPPRVLFTGTMSYPPNRQGIVWFADEVWPRVRERVPGALLDVVGRDPPRSVQALGERDGITVTGFVPSMARYFARATAVVAPILTGAGIRVKIIEALAAGRAVASTPLGMEGLALEPGRHLLVGDDAIELADAVLRLLRDGDLRARLEAEGRAIAEREYDWRPLGEQLEAVLEAATRR